ncbi:hypothetical protein BC936DRAFT_138030 [Jimgerdemannia flammicorona]|uniref:Cyclin C-terminal domain-containing protein n=1 Tax=Jimgerdemannia flammicorona TaxID=994334 RepID=A0A433CW16_9FUNG|nr:hypothetical protein BC936DRAFT_138030 [Jimgerdemannia flammicorona]
MNESCFLAPWIAAFASTCLRFSPVLAYLPLWLLLDRCVTALHRTPPSLHPNIPNNNVRAPLVPAEPLADVRTARLNTFTSRRHPGRPGGGPAESGLRAHSECRHSAQNATGRNGYSSGPVPTLLLPGQPQEIRHRGYRHGRTFPLLQDLRVSCAPELPDDRVRLPHQADQGTGEPRPDGWVFADGLRHEECAGSGRDADSQTARVQRTRAAAVRTDGQLPTRAEPDRARALRTPIHVAYPPPTVACAAIWLAARDEKVRLPESPSPWWELFDAELEEVRTAAAHVVRLYRRRLDRPILPLTSAEVERWASKEKERTREEAEAKVEAGEMMETMKVEMGEEGEVEEEEEKEARERAEATLKAVAGTGMWSGV